MSIVVIVLIISSNCKFVGVLWGIVGSVENELVSDVVYIVFIVKVMLNSMFINRLMFGWCMVILVVFECVENVNCSVVVYVIVDSIMMMLSSLVFF